MANQIQVQIQVQIKTVYGKEAIYPVCEQGKLFAALTGTKTLSRQNLEMIKALGFEIVVQQVTL